MLRLTYNKYFSFNDGRYGLFRDVGIANFNEREFGIGFFQRREYHPPPPPPFNLGKNITDDKANYSHTAGIKERFS